MTRTRPPFTLRVAATAAALTAVLAVLPAAAGAITVNTTADDAPAIDQCEGVPGDCSLRQAIDEANATPGPDTVVLPAGTYPLTIKGTSDDDGISGDLDVTVGEVRIDGAGARTTVVDAKGLEDRAFDVRVSARLVLSRLTVTGAEVKNEGGGAIRAERSDLELDQVAVTGNAATGSSGGGGAIALYESETNIYRSVISDNRVSGNGGGIAAGFSDLALENSTVADNLVDTAFHPGAPGWGAYGGAMEVNGGTLEMKNVTIAGNRIVDSHGDSGEGSGAALYSWELDGSEVVNTIVYGNTATNTYELGQCTDTLDGTGSNLEQAPPAGEPRCFEAASDLIADPLLGALADNGGDTDTMALTSDSPAFNAANPAFCPATDQRGVPRPQLGGCDIGAFELAPPPPAPPTPPTPPAGGSSTPPATEPKAPLAPSIKRRGRVQVTVSGKGFRVRPTFVVLCPAGGARCTGTLKAHARIAPAATAGATSSAKQKRVAVGSAKFTVAPGKSAKPSLRLNAKGAEALSELGKLRVQFSIASRAGNGPEASAKATFKLRG